MTDPGPSALKISGEAPRRMKNDQQGHAGDHRDCNCFIWAVNSGAAAASAKVECRPWQEKQANLRAHQAVL